MFHIFCMQTLSSIQISGHSKIPSLLPFSSPNVHLFAGVPPTYLCFFRSQLASLRMGWSLTSIPFSVVRRIERWPQVQASAACQPISKPGGQTKQHASHYPVYCCGYTCIIVFNWTWEQACMRSRSCGNFTRSRKSCISSTSGCCPHIIMLTRAHDALVKLGHCSRKHK